jgi:sialic acid synthase SpsE
VTIGQHRIGPGGSTFIVAEAGVNHDGSVETALRLVDAAVQAGADAVKFQMFRADDLVASSASAASYQHSGSGATSQRKMLSRLELSQAAFRRIKEHCDQRAVLFLATPFGRREIGELVELGVTAIKIASTDLTDARLLETAAATRLAIILSTGASTSAEISHAVRFLREAGAGERLALLHCVSCYPTPVDAVNLRAVRSLQDSFGLPCGLSDHTTSVRVGAWAVAVGACVLEKHFTLDPAAAGPDHAMSLSPTQLVEYVSAVREVEGALGDGEVVLAECEAEVRAVASKSVVAATHIPAGTRLTPEMLTVKRPGTGIPAADLERLVDHRTTVDITYDTVLSWEMVR